VNHGFLKAMPIRDLVSIALFAAFIIALGLIPAVPVPILPGVPITMQSMGFMLSGALLGGKRAFLCAVVIWVLVAAGLPILAGGRGGIGVFVGPTAGYLFGNGFGAALIGFLFAKTRPPVSMVKIVLFLALGGIIVTYSMGILWLYIVTKGTSLWALIMSNLVFLPGAAIKIAICCFLIKIIGRALPEFFAPAK